MSKYYVQEYTDGVDPDTGEPNPSGPIVRCPFCGTDVDFAGFGDGFSEFCECGAEWVGNSSGEAFDMWADDHDIEPHVLYNIDDTEIVDDWVMRLVKIDEPYNGDGDLWASQAIVLHSPQKTKKHRISYSSTDTSWEIRGDFVWSSGVCPVEPDRVCLQEMDGRKILNSFHAIRDGERMVTTSRSSGNTIDWPLPEKMGRGSEVVLVRLPEEQWGSLSMQPYRIVEIRE